jgi:hypothetical protein
MEMIAHQPLTGVGIDRFLCKSPFTAIKPKRENADTQHKMAIS